MCLKPPKYLKRQKLNGCVYNIPNKFVFEGFDIQIFLNGKIKIKGLTKEHIEVYNIGEQKIAQVKENRSAYYQEQKAQAEKKRLARLKKLNGRSRFTKLD